jgi:hypothetical protein
MTLCDGSSNPRWAPAALGFLPRGGAEWRCGTLRHPVASIVAESCLDSTALPVYFDPRSPDRFLVETDSRWGCGCQDAWLLAISSRQAVSAASLGG